MSSSLSAKEFFLRVKRYKNFPAMNHFYMTREGNSNRRGTLQKFRISLSNYAYFKKKKKGRRKKERKKEKAFSS